MEAHLGVIGKKLLNRPGPVRRKIIENGVDFLCPAGAVDQVANEGDEFLAGIPFGRFCLNFAGLEYPALHMATASRAVQGRFHQYALRARPAQAHFGSRLATRPVCASVLRLMLLLFAQRRNQAWARSRAAGRCGKLIG